MRFTVPVLLILGLAAGSLPARAQTSGGTDVPDRLRLEGGYFRVGSQSTLRLGAATGDIDFEQQLDIPSTTDQGYFELYWRVARRHLVSVAYTRIARSGADVTLDRDVDWGGIVFPVGVTASGKTDSDYVSGAYRFAIVRNDKFELGPSLGIGYLWVKASIRGQVRVGGVTAPPIERTGEVAEPTGSLGGYLQWWPARRVLLRGEARYIAVSSGDTDASVTEARASLLWHPWRSVGIGAQYQYVEFTYDRTPAAAALGGSYRWDGIQALVSFAF